MEYQFAEGGVMGYDVWVLSEKSGQWEPYTVIPFPRREHAEGWARQHIPSATYEVKARGPEEAVAVERLKRRTKS